jgi:uncharacterized protein YecE (DUF72 family)
MASGLGDIRIGCSGWNYKHWREHVYPRGLPTARWLERYAELFDCVEVNATFYRLPTRSAVAGWAESSPDGFVFAVKVSRYLTHMKKLTGVADGMRRLFERIEPLVDAGKLGPLLWQLPEWMARDDDRLVGALVELPSGVRHAFEFRNASWFVPEVEALLARHGAALVVGDHPRRGFQTLARTAGFMFVRFHYGGGDGEGGYSQDEIATWAGRIRDWAAEGDVHAYFNNDWPTGDPPFPAAIRDGLVLRAHLADAAG